MRLPLEGGGRCVRGLDGDRRARKLLDRRPSRWTHRVGVTGSVRDSATPTRNAIGLSRPTACVVTVADGRLSPWRSVLPPLGGGAREPGAGRPPSVPSGLRATDSVRKSGAIRERRFLLPPPFLGASTCSLIRIQSFLQLTNHRLYYNNDLLWGVKLLRKSRSGKSRNCFAPNWINTAKRARQ